MVRSGQKLKRVNCFFLQFVTIMPCKNKMLYLYKAPLFVSSN